MKSGFKVRRITITIAAIFSAFSEKIGSKIIDDFFQSIDMSKEFFSSASSIIIYVVSFFIALAIAQVLLKSKIIRKYIFHEKIVEGTWFEVIFSDDSLTKKIGYGVVATYYDSDGEFVYEGIDYDLNTFKPIGQFSSTCSSLKYYDGNGNSATLDYAYRYTHEDKETRGYGYISFITGKYSSKKHSGRFVSSDGAISFFDAILIEDKKMLRQLSGSGPSFRLVFKQLIQKYEEGYELQTAKHNEIYQKMPEIFDLFSQYEDNINHNIQKIFSNKDLFDFENKSILDIGSGTGRFINYIPKPQNAKRIVCTDKSELMIKYSKEKNKHLNIEFVLCDHAEIAELIDGKFDYIIAGYTIGSYLNKEPRSEEQNEKVLSKLLDTCNNLLAENGMLMIFESISVNENTFSYDYKLKKYFEYLLKKGFSLEKIDTSFCFDNEKKAHEIIGQFWGIEGINCITRKNGKYILQETTGLFTKKKTK